MSALIFTGGFARKACSQGRPGHSVRCMQTLQRLHLPGFSVSRFVGFGGGDAVQLVRTLPCHAMYGESGRPGRSTLHSFCVITSEVMGSDGMWRAANPLNFQLSHLSARPLLRLTNRLLYH